MSDQAAEGLTVIEGGKKETATDKWTAAPPGSKPWAARVRRRAKELAATLDMGYMELARILYQVYDTPIDGERRKAPIYTAWGFRSFADYAERELGLHQKKAERLRLIWFKLEIELKDLDPQLKERMVALGHSKVRELTRILTIRNAKDWVDRAEGLTYRQLFAAVQDEGRRLGLAQALSDAEKAEAVADASEGETALLPELAPVEERRRETFDLFPLQLANVRLALQKSMELGNTDKKGHALDLICTDFLATNDIMGGDLDKRLRYVAKIERTLGLRLVAIDPEATEIVYGLDALKLIADG